MNMRTMNMIAMLLTLLIGTTMCSKHAMNNSDENNINNLLASKTQVVDVFAEVVDVFDVAGTGYEASLHVRFRFSWLHSSANKSAHWSPRIRLANLIQAAPTPSYMSDTSQVYRVDSHRSEMVIDARGSFAQRFDWSRFPFDVQHFEVAVDIEDEEAMLVSRHVSLASRKMSCSAFDFADASVSMSDRVGVVEQLGVERNVSTARVRVRARREWHQVVADRAVPALMATMVSMLQFFAPITEFATRSSIAVWSLLALAVIQGHTMLTLPPSDTLSYLEVFGLVNFAVVFAGVLELQLAHRLERKLKRKQRFWLDWYSRLVFPSLFVIVNVALFLFYAVSSPIAAWVELVCALLALFALALLLGRHFHKRLRKRFMSLKATFGRDDDNVRHRASIQSPLLSNPSSIGDSDIESDESDELFSRF
jgi:hypothetical protein